MKINTALDIKVNHVCQLFEPFKAQFQSSVLQTGIYIWWWSSLDFFFPATSTDKHKTSKPKRGRPQPIEYGSTSTGKQRRTSQKATHELVAMHAATPSHIIGGKGRSTRGTADIVVFIPKAIPSLSLSSFFPPCTRVPCVEPRR